LSLVQRIERRLKSTSQFLTQVGRLEMVSFVLSAIPTLYIGKIKLSLTMIKLIDRYKKHCIWRGAYLNARKPPLATWKLVTRPKNEGGLRVLILEIQNDSRLMKNCHKSFNRTKCPWV
jgi:hypothetical protein